MRKLFTATMLLYCCWAFCAQGEIQINEIMACNGVYENGKAYEWIELKNPGDDPAPLAGITLTYTRRGESQVFTFEGGSLPAGGYAVVYCIENDAVPARGKDVYAPLDLSPKGGVFTLSRDGVTIDRIEIGQQWGNITSGRVGDSEEWRFLAQPTRGTPNSDRGYERRAAAPVFSSSGGWMARDAAITITAEKGAQIHYTLDGTEPGPASALYTAPILCAQPVACIRARAFLEGTLPSETVTNTYFSAANPSVPVISLVTDEKYLTDPKTGLLVPGGGAVKNYDRDWEYPISVEYFDEAGRRLIGQTATFRVTGATSKKYGQKSLSLFARSAYGSKYFSFQPFANREGYTAYRALTLRAAGTESFLTRFRDAMLTSRAGDLNIAYQESTPVIVYINGRYWGHYNLRERINKYFLAQFEGIKDQALIDGVTIIKGRGEVQQGSRREWDELIDFCKKNDLNRQENLAWIDQRLDIDNFFTHIAIQMITGNADIGNQRYYKFPGGEWKCVLYDLDAGMENLKQGPIRYYHKTPMENSNLFYHEPFAALIRAPAMKERFFTIMGQVILRYLPVDLTREVDAWAARLEPLMADQISRWPKCSPQSMGTWRYEVNVFRRICAQRPEKAVDMACNVYNVSKADKKRYFADFYQAIGK